MMEAPLSLPVLQTPLPLPLHSSLLCPAPQQRYCHTHHVYYATHLYVAGCELCATNFSSHHATATAVFPTAVALSAPAAAAYCHRQPAWLHPMLPGK